MILTDKKFKQLTLDSSDLIVYKTDGFTAYEPIDMDKLDRFLSSKLSNDKYIFKALQRLKKHMILNDGKNKVIYRKNKDTKRGRVYDSNSTHFLMSILKNTILEDGIIDLDIVNCQPVIYYNLMKRLGFDMSNSYVKYLIENRDGILKDIMNKYGLDRSQTKEIFIGIMYGMSKKRTIEDYGNVFDYEIGGIKFIDGFYNECHFFMDFIYKMDCKFVKDIKKAREYRKASVLSLLIQETENNILGIVLSYLINKGYIVNRECVLMFDGIMFKYLDCKEKLVNEINEYLMEKIGFEYLRFTTKELEVYGDDEIVFDKYSFIDELYRPFINDIKIHSLIDNEYLTQVIDIDELMKEKTIIIESGTGTGKTTLVNSIFEKDNNKKISITALMSLAEQHAKSLDVHTYLDIEDYYIDTNESVVCINSLMRYSNISNFKGYTVYIDEINSFIKNLIKNSLIKDRNKIFQLLMKMINECDRLILTDAKINDTIFKLILMRDDYYFIKNEYKKDVECVIINDEEKFINMIRERIERREHFLFPCDSKKKITELYLYFEKEGLFKGHEDKYVLITSESEIGFDRDFSFEGKTVFYSPSIKYGVDYNNKDNEQDVFTYIRGNSIDVEEIEQMMARTRHIKTSYIYFDGISNMNREYKNINHCLMEAGGMEEELNKDDLNAFKKIHYKLVDGDAYYLYHFKLIESYVEYRHDLLISNKKEILLRILKDKGYNISYEGEKKKLNRETKREMKENVLMNKEEGLELFIKNRLNDESCCLRGIDYRKTFDYIHELKLVDIDEIDMFKDLFMDENEYKKYQEIIGLMKLYKNTDAINGIVDNKKIDYKYMIGEENTYNDKSTGIYNKIYILNEICNEYNIDIFDNINKHIVNGKVEDELIDFDEKMMERIRNVFKVKRKDNRGYDKLKVKTPKRLYDLIGLIKKCIDTIDKDLIKTTGKIKKGMNLLTNSTVKFNIYEIDIEKINKYIRFKTYDFRDIINYYRNQDGYLDVLEEPFKDDILNSIYNHHKNDIYNKVDREVAERLYYDYVMKQENRD